MLKRIEKSQVRPGMFIEDLEGSWSDNPFESRRFLLETDEQLVRLRGSKIDGIIINTAMGADIGGIVATPKPASRTASARKPLAAMKERRERASQIIAESEAVVEGLFRNARANGAISTADAAPVVAEISDAMRRDPMIFVSVSRLKSKDETTFLHSIAVGALMVQFGRYLRLEEAAVHMLGVSGLLHDIGKMNVPDDILSKEGKLTEDELRQMRNHPRLGHAILAASGDMPQVVLDVCLYHHERMDGEGYPEGLSGDDLSLPVRMAAICDVFEAITSARPYKKPWKQADAIAWMLDRTGHFDRPLLREFVASLELMARNSKSFAG
jgi:HD-GYP domain-containing protein (c-di-GMP phosphodiesterase class II)